MLEVPRNAYATWHVAKLVVNHLHSTNGEWPRGWDDIDKALSRGQVRTHGQSLEELKGLIEIDFSVDPKRFLAEAQSNGKPPRVIRLRNGQDTHWEHAEPNELIHEYLKDPQAFIQNGGLP
jgi:hypothetical protein